MALKTVRSVWLKMIIWFSMMLTSISSAIPVVLISSVPEEQNWKPMNSLQLLRMSAKSTELRPLSSSAEMIPIPMQRFWRNTLRRMIPVFRWLGARKPLTAIWRMKILNAHSALIPQPRRTARLSETLKEMRIQRRNTGISLRSWAVPLRMLLWNAHLKLSRISAWSQKKFRLRKCRFPRLRITLRILLKSVRRREWTSVSRSFRKALLNLYRNSQH